MYSNSNLWWLLPRNSWNDCVNKTPKKKCDNAIHGQVGMRCGEISEMPEHICGPECLCSSLHGTCKIKDRSDQKERQRIAPRKLVP